MIELIFPKIKSNSIGTTYKTRHQITVLEQIIGEFEELHLNDKHFPLRDLDVNLLSKRNYVLDKPNETKKVYIDLSPNKRKYSGCCSTYSFKQVIKVQLEQHRTLQLLSY